MMLKIYNDFILFSLIMFGNPVGDISYVIRKYLILTGFGII
jgi:hypothetical protein